MGMTGRHALAAWMLATAALLTGCASQQDAAARVVADAEQTLQSLKQDAQQLAPEQYAAAEQAIASLRAQLEKRDFAGVVTALPAITSQLTALQELATQRGAEVGAALERARAQWSTLSNDLPRQLDALQRRVDELARAAQLPAGIDRALLERARKTLDELRAAWAEALAAASQGRVPEAAERARESRERALQLERELGLQQT